MKKLLLKSEKTFFIIIALFISKISNGQDYFDSNGIIIWNATTNSGYNNNINLIGRDDTISLNQKQNTISSSNIGLGTIASSNVANPNTFGGDRMYLVWGDNGTSMNDSGTDLTLTFGGASNVTTLVDIPNKIWKIVETGGDVATTKIAINTTDLSGLPALTLNDEYVLIVANDASFSSNVETVFLKTNGLKQECDYDFDGTKYYTFGVAHQSNYSRHATFDGVDDLIKFDAVNNLNKSFTMMFWLRPNGQNIMSNDRTIASKYDGSNGYRVFLSSDNKLNITWTGGNTLTSITTLPNSIWHNIAIVYSGGFTKLYIDGVLDSKVSSLIPASDDNFFSIGAEFRHKSDIRNYFNGDIDEFRLWKAGLTLTQIKFIINQEILQNGLITKGAILPQNTTKNDISTLKWANLVAYYSMNSFIGTHIDDDSSFNNRGYSFLSNKVTISFQSAPLPYESITDGDWLNSSTWANGTIQTIPNSLSIVNGAISINWDIVKVKTNINSTTNKILLGLIVNNNTLSASNDSKIEISHYLKLDGKIDLVGKSQLVQTNNSDLDVASSGIIEKDQQGQSSKYNYNYWSSPVSSINNSTINHGFSVAGVMKDGTTSTPQNLNWTTGVDGLPTSPITLSSYWVFKFQNLNNSYANWSSVGPNGALLAGQGYTLKGCNALTANQNYTFVGKPNNGTITSIVSANNLNLCGNPYPSAIDAVKFIDDNVSSITGTLYYWEHFNTNSSHNTNEYQGGYATYTKTGGTAPVALVGGSGLGSSSKKPKRFIPVGQGFFVTGTPSGGTITFKNSQRAFVKEDSSKSFALFKTGLTQIVNSSMVNNDDVDQLIEENFIKLYLGFNSANNYHRQILIGFMNQYSTSGFDNGYDALSIETLSNDMYFINNSKKLNIQSEGYFNVNNIYPLGVRNATSGIVKFELDNLENFPQDQEVYIYDSLNNHYHSIKNQVFEINLAEGIFEDRFSLRFTTSTTLGTNEYELINNLIVSHSQSDNMINIKNELQDVYIKSVILYNLLGQNVTNWKMDNQNQTNIKLPIFSINSGAYIVKIITDKGDVTKKIVIN